jgi:hypothetical protein
MRTERKVGVCLPYQIGTLILLKTLLRQTLAYIGGLAEREKERIQIGWRG